MKSRANLSVLPKSISYRIKEILEIEDVKEIPTPSGTQRGRCALCDRKKIVLPAINIHMKQIVNRTFRIPKNLSHRIRRAPFSS
nr:unnamed protein product [Callosobruchus chinensis]